MSLELKDRIPTRPNRKLITPEGGGTPYFATVVHADEPVEVGTPINKSTLNNVLTEANTFTTSRTGINATEARPWTDFPEIVLIKYVPVDVTHITFVAISDFKQSDVYCILYANALDAWNDKIKLTITDLAGEPLNDGIWKTGAPVSLIIQGDKAFFKGGGGTYGTLPPQIKQFTAKAGNHQITLSWTNPSDSNFAGLYLVRKQGSMPTKLSDGIKIDVEMATTYTDNEPENDKLYYYRAFTYNAKKQVQTELTGAVVSATPKAFSLPQFTGQHAIFGNEEKGRIEMYSSGTLTLSEATYDLFVVGGGGGGTIGGGGGGYTKTLTNQNLSKNLAVTIGAGGERVQSGGTTSISSLLSAVGGKSGGEADGSYQLGGDGGSGGGGGTRKSALHGGAGGSNGSDGEVGERQGGKGQGATTKSFGETNGTLYAGGGGGFGYSDKGGSGGSGGGGKGGSNNEKGTANTGGGAGGGVMWDNWTSGGSGIAIVRWGY